MKGRVLAVNTGSTSTKIGFFDGGEKLFEKNLTHSVEELSKYESVMDQDQMRLGTIMDFLSEKGIALESIDIVMARGGLITPIKTGVYWVNDDMKEALREAKEGKHACNLSALIAADIADKVNEARAAKGLTADCGSFIADPPMADEMLPEAKIGGLPEFPRRALFHALNSRAIGRRYAREHETDYNKVTVIVAHLGGGTSVTLHRNGEVIDTNDALGGDGPISPERAGSVPGFPLVEMCFSGKYTKAEVMKKLVGKGGAVGFFGTNNFKSVVDRAAAGDPECKVFIDGYCLSIAKYIGALATDVCGKVDAILITGGIARSQAVIENVTSKVSFIAPVKVYPGEDELESLAENGYGILAKEFEIKTYHKEG